MDICRKGVGMIRSFLLKEPEETFQKEATEETENLRRAYELLRNLNNYQHAVERTHEYSQQRLRETFEPGGYMDFEKYVENHMTTAYAMETDFGLLRQPDTPRPEQARKAKQGIMICAEILAACGFGTAEMMKRQADRNACLRLRRPRKLQRIGAIPCRGNGTAARYTS